MRFVKLFFGALLITMLVTGFGPLGPMKPMSMMGPTMAHASAGPMQAPKEIDRSTRFIEEYLLCQCGCTMGVAYCDCGTAGEMRDRIAGMMKEGKNQQQILDWFVGEYGEQVLTAPTKTGFNLSAWITPFAALLAGFAVLWALIRAWVRKHEATVAAGGDAPEALPELTETEQAYADKIGDVLRRHY